MDEIKNKKHDLLKRKREWWGPAYGNEWWEKSVEEEFLKDNNRGRDEFSNNESHDFTRLKKIEEFINRKIGVKERISQTENLKFTLEEANSKIMEEILALSSKEDSLIFKNLSHLFDHHFAENNSYLEDA